MFNTLKYFDPEKKPLPWLVPPVQSDGYQDDPRLPVGLVLRYFDKKTGTGVYDLLGTDVAGVRAPGWDCCAFDWHGSVVLS